MLVRPAGLRGSALSPSRLTHWVVGTLLLGVALARQQGQDEREVVHHLFQKLSLVLMRGNAQLLVNRVPPNDSPGGEVDGIE